MTLSTNDIIHHKILLLHHLFHAFQSKTQRINEIEKRIEHIYMMYIYKYLEQWQ